MILGKCGVGDLGQDGKVVSVEVDLVRVNTFGIYFGATEVQDYRMGTKLLPPIHFEDQVDLWYA